MKVLFAATSPYMPLHYGGAEISTHDLVLWCRKSGVDVGVLSSLIVTKTLASYRYRLNARISANRLARDRDLGYPVFRGWDPVQALPGLLDREGYELVVLQGGNTKALARAAIKSKVKVLLYLRDLSFRFGEEDRDILDEAAFVANSRYTASVFQEQTGLEPAIIPPLVYSQYYKNDKPGGEVLFINPNAGKGMAVGLRLVELCPDIPFIFVQGWGLSEKEAEAERQRTSHLVNLTWLESTADMRSLYARAKVVLAPTGATYGCDSPIVEAWGRVATEAQLSGIPVLATDLGGFPESVGDGGLLVPADAGIAEWHEALRGLWDNERLYNSCSTQARLRSNRVDIQPEVLLDRFLSLCERVTRSTLRRQTGAPELRPTHSGYFS